MFLCFYTLIKPKINQKCDWFNNQYIVYYIRTNLSIVPIKISRHFNMTHFFKLWKRNKNSTYYSIIGVYVMNSCGKVTWDEFINTFESAHTLGLHIFDLSTFLTWVDWRRTKCTTYTLGSHFNIFVLRLNRLTNIWASFFFNS